MSDDGKGSGTGITVRTFEPGDTEALVALWRECGLTRPWNDPHRDIERRRAIDDGLFLVGLAGADAAAENADRTAANDGAAPAGRADGRADAPALIASAMGGYDGHRGWVYYVAVHPGRRGRGHARTLMAALETRLLARGCPKINLQVREGNAAALAFYARLGYAVDRVAGLGKRLVPDD